MKKNSLFRAALAALAGTAILVACGGGSGSGSGSAPTGTTAAPASASGVLSAFGSVFVNGREYATGSKTSVVDGDADDAASALAALQVGMTVDVDSDGNASSPGATRIRYSSAVRGEIDAIDTAGSKIAVLGQTVLVTSATSFAGTKSVSGASTPVSQLGSLAVGDYVVVYGFLQCTSSGAACTADSIVANLVYAPPSAGAYRAEGYVQNLNSAGKAFTLNGLAVTLSSSGSSATVCSPSPCALANGQFVAVRSATAPSASAGTLTLAADHIRSTTLAPVLASGSTVSLEGPVAALNATAGTFDVRGIAINASTLTATLATLANGDMVEVSGTVNADGSIQATAVTLERHAEFSVEAPLDAASASASTVTLLGQTFAVNSATRFVDWAQGVRPFNAANFATVLAAKDQLIVSGYTGSGGNVATRVERIATPASPTAGVQGVASADSSSAATVTVGGVMVDLSATTKLYYGGAAGTPSLAGFFAAVTPNTTVVVALGAPGSTAGTIAAADAAALPGSSSWVPGSH